MTDRRYAPGYFESEGSYIAVVNGRAAIEEEWGVRWRHILRLIAARRVGPELLDVGAGNGYFVNLARSEFRLEAHGVEPSERNVRFARDVLGTNLILGDITACHATYDVVTAFNVLEHVEDPFDLLSEMALRLRQGGVLVLTTPNPSCIQVRLGGLRRWSMVWNSQHTNLFPRTAVGALLRRIGFVAVHYETLSTYVRFVRKVDTGGFLLRRTAFNALRCLGLGADHLVLACRARSA